MGNKNSDKKKISADVPIILYHYWRSSASWRVRWAFAHKEIPIKKIAINLLNNEQYSPGFLAINPAGQVPALVVDGRSFSESMAMLEYIEERFPQNPLLPSDLPSRMFVRELCLTIIAGTHPLQNLLPQQRHSSDPIQRKEFAQFFIARGLQVYEQLIHKTAGTFSFGSQLTIADICLVPQIYNACRYDVSLNDMPIIKRIYGHCRKLVSCSSSDPESHLESKI